MTVVAKDKLPQIRPVTAAEAVDREFIYTVFFVFPFLLWQQKLQQQQQQQAAAAAAAS